MNVKTRLRKIEQTLPPPIDADKERRQEFFRTLPFAVLKTWNDAHRMAGVSVFDLDRINLWPQLKLQIQQAIDAGQWQGEENLPVVDPEEHQELLCWLEANESQIDPLTTHPIRPWIKMPAHYLLYCMKKGPCLNEAWITVSIVRKLRESLQGRQ